MPRIDYSYRMSVRLIAGPAGSGKTHTCIKQIAEELLPSPAEGPRLVLLVPEQAALQMERALLTTGGCPALGRCEVLSFRRLARRILQETGAPGLTPLSPLGRQMVLRLLIDRNAKRLREFQSVADRPGFVAGLASTLTELLQESVTIDELIAASDAADSSNDPTAPRLHDLAMLYREYLKYLSDERVDPESVLDLARARIDALDWIAGSRVWIDGFAGFTRQQSRMIVALAQRATAVNIALLLDPRDRRAVSADQPPDDWSLFARTDRTWFGLSHQLREAGVAIDPPLRLETTPRFAAPSLAILEHRLFNQDRYAGASKTPPPTDSAVRLVSATNRRVEVDAAINAMVDLAHEPIRPMRWRDMAIIVRNLEPYHDLISAALNERGIPFFIDHRRSTTHHPLVEVIRAALAMHGDPGQFGDAAILLLKSGFSGIALHDADALENYILAQGLHDAALWGKPWTHPIRHESDTNRPRPQAEIDALAAINGSRNRLVSMLKPWLDLESTAGVGSQPTSTWIKSLYQLLAALDVQSQLANMCRAADARGDLDAIEVHEQVWLDLMALFDDLVTALGDERLSPRRLREVLESALSEFTLGLVPPTIDQVLVGSIERSRHPMVRAVFVLGFGDGQFPASTSESDVLGDDERAILAKSGVELTQSRARRMLDERMLAYIALTRASERLWISHPAADENGRPLEPSPYWETVRSILPHVVVEEVNGAGLDGIGSAAQLAGRMAGALRAMAEERMAPDAAGAWASAYECARKRAQLAGPISAALRSLAPPQPIKLDDTVIPALWADPHESSVSRLEDFARCPFKHYVAHGLQLKPRAIAELSPLQMGTLYHAVMEQFVNELIDSKLALRNLKLKDIDDRITRLTKKSIETLGKQVRIDKDETGRLNRNGNFELGASIRGERAHLDQTELTPAFTEHVFGLGPRPDLPALELKLSENRVVTLRGKIDRIDIVKAGNKAIAVVFDYKRKLEERLRLDEAFHGLRLQLLSYLLVLRENDIRHNGARIVPGGAFYLPMLGKYNPVDHPDDAKEDSFRAFASYRPRGILDFDCIDHLDPNLSDKGGASEVFQVYFKKSEDDDKTAEIGYLDRSDAVPSGMMTALLDRTRQILTELAERWLSGDIRALPYRRGLEVACSQCEYQAICRVETVTRQTRPLEVLSRKEVIRHLGGDVGDRPAAGDKTND